MSASLLVACLVIGISDGDTLTALCHERPPIKVRLAEIDAPEKAQPFGQRSKQSLAQICFRRSADIRIQSTDRYKRHVARVTCNGVDANAEQVKQGMAWVYDRYVQDRSLYAIQDEARQSGLGLWADQAPMPPWEWRRLEKR